MNPYVLLCFYGMLLQLTWFVTLQPPLHLPFLRTLQAGACQAPAAMAQPAEPRAMATFVAVQLFHWNDALDI